MRKEIYESIIKNGQISYLKINCRKNCHNKYIGIEVIEQSKEFKDLFEILTGNSFVNKDITERIINNWIKENYKNDDFHNFITKIISQHHKKIKYNTKGNDEHIMVDIYYIDDEFILIFSMDEDFEKDINQKIIEDKMKIKMDFFANISHDLRTPINIISSTVQLMKLKLNKLSLQGDNNLDKYMEIMDINIMRLVRLIDNLIDSTKIDAGFLNFKPINSDIIKFIEDTCDSIIDYASSNKINLIFDTDKEEEIVLFDPDIIERVMLNLLSNAIKFNRTDGNIYVKIFTNNDNIKISVKDEGIGIPEEKLDSIFKRFEQVSNKEKKSKQGSGIGLYLVKSLLELHKGHVEVRSKINEGCEFIVTIPKIILRDEEGISNDENNMDMSYQIAFSDI